MNLMWFNFEFKLGRCRILQKTYCITITKVNISYLFREIILFILRTAKLVNILFVQNAECLILTQVLHMA